MNKEIKIRRGQEEDLEKITDIDKLALKQLWTLEQYKRELGLPNSQFWLLCLKNSQANTEEVVGMGCFRIIASNIEIPILAIHPDYQARGFGRYFFAWLLNNMTYHNLRHARLEVRESNQKAIDFYRQFGFQISGKLNRFYQSNRENGYRMMSPDLTRNSFQQKLNNWLEEYFQNLQEVGFSFAPEQIAKEEG